MNTAFSVNEVLTNTSHIRPTDNWQLDKTNLNQLATDNCTYNEAEELFSVLSDLVNNQYKAWYCKQFYKLSRTKVMELAALAHADGKDSRKLFSFLLKNA